MYDDLFELCVEQVLGNAGSEYTDDEVNFGITTPNVSAMNNFGLHLIVTTTFATLTSGAIMWIAHGAATSPTTKHTGMFIAAADLVAGSHFFIPCGNVPVLQYARGYFEVVSENATAGKATCYFGPGPVSQV
jgi:hypothetical protein